MHISAKVIYNEKTALDVSRVSFEEGKRYALIGAIARKNGL